MPTTANYSWPTPADTDLVKDGAEAIRDLGNAIDTTTKAVADAQGLVHINTTSFSGAVSHSFGSDASPIFTSDYTNYKVILDNLTSTGNVNIDIRLRANTTDETSSNYVRQGLAATSTTVSAARVIATSYSIGSCSGIDNSSILIELTNPQTTDRTHIYSQNMFLESGVGAHYKSFYGYVDLLTQYNGFTILTSANFAGTMSVYGYKK